MCLSARRDSASWSFVSRPASLSRACSFYASLLFSSFFLVLLPRPSVSLPISLPPSLSLISLHEPNQSTTRNPSLPSVNSYFFRLFFLSFRLVSSRLVPSRPYRDEVSRYLSLTRDASLQCLSLHTPKPSPSTLTPKVSSSVGPPAPPTPQKKSHAEIGGKPNRSAPRSDWPVRRRTRTRAPRCAARSTGLRRCEGSIGVRSGGGILGRGKMGGKEGARRGSAEREKRLGG